METSKKITVATTFQAPIGVPFIVQRDFIPILYKKNRAKSPGFSYVFHADGLWFFGLLFLF
ncbi:hypothetical protein ACF5W4_18480 [Bacillota bacterium Lsc_1132]